MTKQIKEISINPIYTKKTISKCKKEDENTEQFTIQSLIRTDQFLEKLQNHFSSNFEILPKNCKYYEKTLHNTKILIIEDEPQIRTITFDNDLLPQIEELKISGKFDKYKLQNKKLNVPYKFNLSFPYIIYIIALDNYYNRPLSRPGLFFRLNPLTSLNDYLIIPSLPNISSEYQICTGEYNKKDNLINQVDEITNSFWFNSFNYDYYDTYELYRNNEDLCDFFTWEYNTKLDPLFIFSTKWLFHDLTLNEVLNDYYRQFDSSETRRLSLFDRFYDYISSSLHEDKESKNVDKEREIRKYERRDLIESYRVPKTSKILSIGDKITIDNKEYNLYSIVTNEYGEKEKLLFEDYETGDISEFLLKNEKNLNVLISKLNVDNNNISEFEINGLKIKTGDLVKFNNNDSIKCVDKIIKCRDESINFKIGDQFYFPSVFENKTVELLNMDELSISGKKLIINEKYILFQSSLARSIIYPLVNVIYKGIKILDNRVYYLFNSCSNSKKEFHVNISNNELYELYLDDELIKQKIVRCNNQIITNKNYIPIFKNQAIGIFTDNLNSSYDLTLFNVSFNYQKEILLEHLESEIKNNKLFIPSLDFDIDYKVGDEIIFIDWNFPQEMLKIRTIKGFEIINEDLIIRTVDDNNEELHIPYINISKGIIQTGHVRKVCRELNDLKSGMKVKASKPGIQDFPLTACNEIIAFVIDEEQPLILFSNYRTLYFNYFDKLKFNIFDENTKIEITKSKNLIKIQIGDLFEHKMYDDDVNNIDIGICYSSASNFKPNRMFYFTHVLKYPYSNSITDYINVVSSKNISNRYGLLYPRYTNEELQNLEIIYGVYGMRGNIFPTNSRSNSIFLLKERIS